MKLAVSRNSIKMNLKLISFILLLVCIGSGCMKRYEEPFDFMRNSEELFSFEKETYTCTAFALDKPFATVIADAKAELTNLGYVLKPGAHPENAQRFAGEGQNKQREVLIIADSLPVRDGTVITFSKKVGVTGVLIEDYNTAQER